MRAHCRPIINRTLYVTLMYGDCNSRLGLQAYYLRKSITVSGGRHSFALLPLTTMGR